MTVAALARIVEATPLSHAQMIENATWLHDRGLAPENICARLSVEPSTLAQIFRRAGHGDTDVCRVVNNLTKTSKEPQPCTTS